MLSKSGRNNCHGFSGHRKTIGWLWIGVIAFGIAEWTTAWSRVGNIGWANSSMVSPGGSELRQESSATADDWILLRDGTLLQGVDVVIESIGVDGLKLAQRQLTWDTIHSLKLTDEQQTAADVWLAELGKPWALAVYRLKLRDWQGAQLMASRMKSALLSANDPPRIANHAAWWTIDQCAWQYHLQRGDWELAQLAYLDLIQRLQTVPSSEWSAYWQVGEPPNGHSQWSEALPPIVLSSRNATRVVERIRSLATPMIVNRDARGCWYIAALAQAAGDHRLAEQYRAAAANFWPEGAKQELNIWQQIQEASQSLDSQRPVEAFQKLSQILPDATDDHQRVSIRLLLAESISRSQQSADWRKVVLAWLQVAAHHEMTHPQLAAYALYRAEIATGNYGTPRESLRIKEQRQQKYPDWREPDRDE